MITGYQELLDWQRRACRQRQGRTVLDLEADSLHRYRERLCLIQYADEQGVEIIDPLALSDEMQPFCEWLAGAEVWMHGADYDMTLLLNAYGVLPRLILDTQIAARLLGHEQFGLAALVEHYFGITLSKKNQKADWGRRPISPDMEQYAQGDVIYMLKMADLMVDKLKALGRYDWFLESCEFNMMRARRRKHVARAPWRIKGSGKLARRGLAALRQLWRWREAEAEVIDRPPFMVCLNEDLLRWSEQIQNFNPVTPLPHGPSLRIAHFRRALREIFSMDEEEYPLLLTRKRKTIPLHPESVIDSLLEKRDAVAAELGIEPALVASRAQLEQTSFTKYDASPEGLMRWQRRLLGLPC